MKKTKLASAFVAGRTLEAGIQRVLLAESLGYDSAWVTQIADREATVVATALAHQTSTIKIGTGVLPLYPRTPVVMAQTAATIDEISGGRFILGVGPSHEITITAWHNLTFEKPLAHTREYVEAVRAIFAGQTYSGDVYSTAFSFVGFEPVRRDIPIFISCLSPKMCRLAGRIADGAALWMCPPNYIESLVVPEIAAGREEVGKTMEGFEVQSAVPLALTDNPAAGRDAWRQVAITYWNLPFYRAAVARAGFHEALKSFDSGGPSAIPDEVVDAFAGIGDEQACWETLDRYRQAGTTLPSIGPLPGHAGSADYETLLKTLAP